MLTRPIGGSVCRVNGSHPPPPAVKTSTSKAGSDRLPGGRSLLSGYATPSGAARYVARHGARFARDFYRPLAPEGPSVSSIGLGTYLGECDADDDARYQRAALTALGGGVNLLDTAINYRCQRSERVVGRALRHAIEGETLARDEVVVCTKGGYIPLDGAAPASREEYQAYLRREYFQRGVIDPSDVVGGGHCIAPSYLADQIDRSRANLGLATIDLYYVHNPEQQLDAIDRGLLRERLLAAFVLLEERCARGDLVRYGCATWNGLRVPPGARGHLSLAELVEIAREAGGAAHHFRVVQAPVSLAMPEAVREPTQRLADGRTVPLLVAAGELGIAVVASAPLLQAALTRDLPLQVRDALPGFTTDAQRALAFVRSLPVVTAALVGMKRPAHVQENLNVARVHQE